MATPHTSTRLSTTLSLNQAYSNMPPFSHTCLWCIFSSATVIVRLSFAEQSLGASQGRPEQEHKSWEWKLFGQKTIKINFWRGGGQIWWRRCCWKMTVILCWHFCSHASHAGTSWQSQLSLHLCKSLLFAPVQYASPYYLHGSALYNSLSTNINVCPAFTVIYLRFHTCAALSKFEPIWQCT